MFRPQRVVGSILATGSAFVAAFVVIAAAQDKPAADAKASIRDIAWLAGSRSGPQGNTLTEEAWTNAAGGTMLGTGRTIAKDRTVFFEFLKIEERDGGLVYIAWPNGKKPTEFRATRISADEAVFENPGHDFPRTIAYRKVGAAVEIRLTGEEGGQRKVVECRLEPRP